MTRRRWWILGIGVVVLTGVAILPSLRDREHLRLDATLRTNAPGRFVELRDGVTHFELTGPKDGPRVVLIHGVSGPMGVWDRATPALVKAGFRVLRYDQFGRGYSDRVDIDHDEEFYERQLGELLDAIGWQQPVTLIGSSMGALIATRFTNEHPTRVARVVLVGPAGFPIEGGATTAVLGVPGLGEYIMSAFGDEMLSEHHKKYFVDPERGRALQHAFEAQLEVIGTKRSIRSTMTRMPVTQYEEGYRRLGQSGKPVRIVWGRDDQTFRFIHSERALELIPQGSLVPIDAAAHLPQFERPGAFTRATVPFLRSRSDAGRAHSETR